MVEFLADVTSSTFRQAVGVVDELKKSIESAESTCLPLIKVKLEGEQESDLESEVSESTDDDEGSESIRFYVTLLMNLVPSLEQAYDQMLEEVDGDQSSLISQILVSDVVGDIKSSKSLNSENDTSSVSTKIAPTKNIAEPSTPISRYGKHWAKDLKDQFEQMLAQRPKPKYDASRGMSLSQKGGTRTSRTQLLQGLRGTLI